MPIRALESVVVIPPVCPLVRTPGGLQSVLLQLPFAGFLQPELLRDFSVQLVHVELVEAVLDLLEFSLEGE